LTACRRVLFIIMSLIFLLGFFLDWVEITLVVVPIFSPIVALLDFGLPAEQVMIWF
jgi:TRAP-type mannitol/chloroaromatic compound transport system permease large subunit